MEFTVTGQVIEWRGPAPFYYLPVPEDESAEIRAVAGLASYGWGVIPVTGQVADIEFTTSLFPKDGGYLVPLKDAVRRPLGITVGDEITVALSLRLSR